MIMSRLCIWRLFYLSASVFHVSQALPERTSTPFTTKVLTAGRESTPSGDSIPTRTGDSPINGSIPIPGGKWLSPRYEWIFQYPLQIGTVKVPKSTYEPNDSTKAPIDYYEVEVKTVRKQIYPDRAATELTAYDGESPGPIFRMQQGRGESSVVAELLV